MAADVDGIRPFLLVVLAVIERGLDRLSEIEARVELRRFLKENPTVTTHHWTDGTD